MIAQQIDDIKQDLTELRTKSEERASQANVLRNLMIALLGALVGLGLTIVYYAGAKSAQLERVVSDVGAINSDIKEIKTALYQIPRRP